LIFQGFAPVILGAESGLESGPIPASFETPERAPFRVPAFADFDTRFGRCDGLPAGC
jgi:hypothetical protein